MSYYNVIMCESIAPHVKLINALFFRTEAIPSPQCDGSAPFAVYVACILIQAANLS